MSSTSSFEERARMKEEISDTEKSPAPFAEDVEGQEGPPIEPQGAKLQRTATQPPAPLTELDKGLVAWESLRDPENPIYWPSRKRLINMILICCITFISPLGSSIFAPGVSYTLADLHTSSEAVGSFMITIFLLGYALGPLFLAPLSEIYGRWIVIVGSCWFFTAFLIGCSFVQDMGGLIIMRFFAGMGGSAVMTIAPAIVADLYPLEKRSAAMAVVLMVQSVSPAAGPICGGFIAERLSWRWVYWILIIASGTVTTLITFFFSECYAPAVLNAKTKRLRKELNRPELVSKLALPITRMELLKRSLIRPSKLLTHSPVAFFCALYVAINYAFLYLLFTTVTSVFVDYYDFSVEIAGLTYIGFAIGMVIVLIILMQTQDGMVARLRAANGGVFEPEMRLKNMVYICMWIGPALLLFGWTAEYHVHWIVPIIALGIFGFSLVGIFMSTQTYVVDSFVQYSASAVAAVMVLRSLVGTFLPFAGPPLFDSLGVGWGSTVLGLISIVLAPTIPLFRRYGRTIRLKFPVEL